MFCPNCGKDEQQKNTYCRNCGEFLSDTSGKRKGMEFGGDTPEEQIKTNLYLNLLSALVSLFLAIALIATFFGQDVHWIIHLTVGFLLAISGWQFTTFNIGTKLRKNFSKRREDVSFENQKTETYLDSAQTRELLNEGNFENVIPMSIAEKTTKNLTEKVKR